MREWTDFGFITLWVLSFSVQALRYSLFAGLAFYIMQVVVIRKMVSKRLRQEKIDSKYVFIDIGRSCLSFFIFGAMMAATMIAHQHGYTKLYGRWSDQSYWYAFGSFLLLLFIHDTYFYWMHRLLHTKLLYRYIHKHHHRPTPPTPFTSFAFHPLEAIVEFVFIIPAVMILPLHPIVLFAFANVMTAMNVWGHLGFELFPEKYLQGMVGRIMNSTTHHDMHHQYNKCNYGLYFNFWDSIMHTNHKQYRRLQKREK